LTLPEHNLFVNLKEYLKGRKSPSVEEPTIAEDEWFVEV
jgi:hypothetical protein